MDSSHREQPTSQIFVRTEFQNIDWNVRNGSNCLRFIINLDAGPFRRVGFPNFVGSHKRLCEAAAELAAADSCAETRVIQYKLRLTFKDEDGDSCLLLNDADVKMAFTESEKPLKIFAEILELSTVKAAAKSTVASPKPTVTTRDTEVAVQTRTAPKPVVPSNKIDHHPPALHQAVESIVGVLANAVIGLQQVSTPTSETGSETTSNEAAPVATKDRSAPDENLEANEPDDEEEEEEENEERLFIHGRHTCDSCLTTPIVGKRFHALNMADYDLCANCYQTYTGEEIQFEEVQLGKNLAIVPIKPGLCRLRFSF